MATNYTISEATKIIAEGKDLEAIREIGRRFPVLVCKVAKIAALAGDEFVSLMSYMPDYLTANKVNSGIIKGNMSDDSEGDSEDKDDSNEDLPKETKKVKPEASDYESMNGKTLFEMVKARGIIKLLKSTKKADMIEGLKANDAGTLVAPVKEEKKVKPEPKEEPKSDSVYGGKAAPELFKECKKRGLKVEPKKKASYYEQILLKADAEPKEEKVDDENWDDVAEEKKPAEKAKVEKADDADDDWDI